MYTLPRGQQAPWPFLTEWQAARQLNLTTDLLDEIARSGRIPAVRAQHNKKGHPNLWLFKKSAIQDLADKLTEER